MILKQDTEYICRLCKSKDVSLVKEANIKNALESNDFKITDSRYGVMLSVFACRDCGFLQCLDAPDPTDFYRKLEDQEYEISRKERIYQAKRILEKIGKHLGGKFDGLRLLDIGAGSGILLAAASDLGFTAEGVEPSDWLRKAAENHGCSITADVLPHPAICGPYDVITLIDVVEHVPDPLDLVGHAASLLKSGGLMAIVTPDVQSVAARLMGWKWWHYRIAHVGYFSKKNLESIVAKLGLKTLSISRPSWSFSLAYIRERLLQYLPKSLVPAQRDWMHNYRIRLNLYDSLLIVAKRP